MMSDDDLRKLRAEFGKTMTAITGTQSKEIISLVGKPEQVLEETRVCDYFVVPDGFGFVGFLEHVGLEEYCSAGFMCLPESTGTLLLHAWSIGLSPEMTAESLRESDCRVLAELCGSGTPIVYWPYMQRDVLVIFPQNNEQVLIEPETTFEEFALEVSRFLNSS
jgi:hypothetical protein